MSTLSHNLNLYVLTPFVMHNKLNSIEINA